MNASILNRDFQHPADGWYQIESLGTHLNEEAGVKQVIDAEALRAIANRFNVDAKEGKLRHGAEMLIDHEHFSDQPDQETRAYGWLKELQAREDGLYGRIRWTSTGQAAVDGGDYRFFSTEYMPEDLKVLNRGKIVTGRPLRLAGLTLTNMPNNRGQRPITNRDTKEFRSGHSPAADDQKPSTQQRTKMKSVCTLLGLSADASEEAAHAEITKMKNRLVTVEGQVAPLQARVTELETSNATLVDEQIAADLDGKGIKDEKVRNRLVPVLKPMKNRAERIAFIEDVVGKPTQAGNGNGGGNSGQPQKKLLNRDTKPPGTATVENDGRAEKVRADKIANRANTLVKDHGFSLATAYRMAQTEEEAAAN